MSVSWIIGRQQPCKHWVCSLLMHQTVAHLTVTVTKYLHWMALAWWLLVTSHEAHATMLTLDWLQDCLLHPSRRSMSQYIQGLSPRLSHSMRLSRQPTWAGLLEALEDHITGFGLCYLVLESSSLTLDGQWTPSAMRHFIWQLQLSQIYKGNISKADPDKHCIIH